MSGGKQSIGCTWSPSPDGHLRIAVREERDLDYGTLLDVFTRKYISLGKSMR